MTSRTLKVLLVGPIAGLLASCASHPKPLPLAAPGPVAPPSASGPPGAYPSPPPPAVQTGVLPGSERDFVVNAGDRVYFDFDKYEIRPDGERVLEAQAAWLDRYPGVRVRIEGNTDERGTEEYNFALGARRAEAVKTFLNLHGVAAGRIATVSYGKDRPIDPGTGEEAWRHNRNAHTVITQGAQPAP